MVVACQEYVMEALLGKTVMLVTHQVDFLPSFDSILVGISISVSLSSIFQLCSLTIERQLT